MTDALDLYTLDDGAMTLSVHVQPRAGRSAVVGRHGHALKVVVAAPPLDDRANEATAAVLAEELGVAPSAVELVGGASSRHADVLFFVFNRSRGNGVIQQTGADGDQSTVATKCDRRSKAWRSLSAR